MHDAETVSMRRAAVLLTVVCVVRWGLTLGGRSESFTGMDVADDLSVATELAAEEGDRRREPLAPGETIDPNRADEATLDRLPGIGPATAAAIVAARDSGLVFRSAGDLATVRGIGPALVERITPMLDTRSPPAGSAVGRAVQRGSASGPRPRRAAAPVDVNHADAETLQSLPGIGPALADRIVEARREGRFVSIEDLARVPGIGPATVERLRGLAVAAPAPGGPRP